MPGRHETRFLFRFALVASLFFVLLEFAPSGFFNAVNYANSFAAGFLLNHAGIDAAIQGDIIRYRGFSARVVGECSALYISVLPLAFFLSFPAGLKFRLAGIAAGLPLIFAVNLFRIVLIFMVALEYPGIFPWVHLYLGQVGMIILVVWVCLAWLKLIHHPLPAARGSSLIRVLGISIIGFVLWIWGCKPYTWLLLKAAAALLSLFGLPVSLPDALGLYPHTFISFNGVIIASFIIADRMTGRETPDKKLLLRLGAGLLLLHLVFQMLPILFFQFKVAQARWAIDAMLALQQFLLPFAAWVAMMPNPPNTRKARPRTKGPAAGTLTG